MRGDTVSAPTLWVERLTLVDFRNYRSLTLTTTSSPVVLVGSNGAGKTNLLEAVSLMAAGQGLRRAPFPDLANAKGAGGWTVAAKLQTADGPTDVGTGLQPDGAKNPRAGRIVRINGDAQSGSGILADLVEMVWLTPAMDGLFTGSGSDRRRFLDRLILCFDPGYRTRLGHFERAMASRNRLLADGVRDNYQLEAFERVMVETGISIAAARLEAVAQLAATIDARRERDPNSPFPWATLAMDGAIEAELRGNPAIAVEENYAKTLATTRERDRGAGRTLDGPHRSDLVVGHGPKGMPAKLCSTGEQKALLIGLVLAHAELVKDRRDGVCPMLLLDEIAAHLDPLRRAALFDEIVRLGGQAWMTGTDPEAFDALKGRAQINRVDDAKVTPLHD
ncbi:MAG: DNA replication/repair protein RecF [Hyphomicrobiaceae bacterium]